MMKKLKKFRLLNNAAVFLLIVSASLFLFTGCQNKNNQNSTDQTNTSYSNVNGSQSNNGRPNADEMKKRMQDNINSLVKDGTINQNQANKILEELTANTQRFNGEKRPQNNQQSTQQNTQQNNPNNNQANKQNRQRNNRLSKLVSDGVITQAQADAVMQKIRGNFNRPLNNSQS